MCTNMHLSISSNFGEDEIVTWVHSSKVPASLIDEYEKCMGVLTERKYGVVSHALVSASRIDNPSGTPPSKKTKLETKEPWDVG